jgi:hAT family C-terminal dimerisation region
VTSSPSILRLVGDTKTLFDRLLTYILDPIEISPLTFWKENQHKYPALAAAARDVLSIPATGAGVERLFNSARDICHYRRGSLNATTIQDLMMFMCVSRFDIEKRQLALISELLSEEEKEEANEEKDTEYLDDLDPISDNEEEDMMLIQEHPTTQGLSERGAGKR